MLVVRLEEQLAMYVEPFDRNCQEGVAQIFEIIRHRFFANLFPFRCHISGNIANRCRFTNVIGYKSHYIFKLAYIADFLPPHYILDKYCVIDAFEIVVYLRVLFRLKCV